MKQIILFSATIAVVLAAPAERKPFEPYEKVIERQMFGPPPEGFDPTKKPSEAVSTRDQRKASQELTKEQEKLKSSIRFSMINVTPSGETAVGFTDSSNSKNPKNYYLKVGESRDGWTVKEADPTASSMTIVKGEVEVSLTIGGDSGKGAGKTAAAGATAPSGAPSVGSLRARRLQRQNERLAQTQAQQAKMDEMLKAMKDREAADARRREEEKAEREAERAEQNARLLELKDQLKRAREEREAEEKTKKEENDASDT